MRLSMRRRMVLGLYKEKSWPVWLRNRIKILFITFSADTVLFVNREG